MLKTIRIKMKLIGNDHFNVETIKMVYGISEFSSLLYQVVTFQEIVENLTEKIIYYKLGDYYDQNLRIQEYINDFCNNLKCVNYYLKRIKRPEPYSVEDFNDRVLTRAVDEIKTKNKAIINALETINEAISYHIETHNLKLFPHPQD